ncbi:MAG TPA: ABC transporter substrate-binding protein [Acetobacteraceae bacterium]|jgi:branched-chain amino acid transport system substrate-binding protein|nr:ABC transporter substrate-binding protein [Acetobacteraceae bacterium]
MVRRRSVVMGSLAGATTGFWRGARADTADLKIGNTMPYSGPASAYAAIGHFESAYFRMVNEHGGISGRRIAFLTYDDSLSPPKTVEEVRRLVEQDQVDFLFNTLGTPTNSAVVRYVNQRKVPHIFLATGADKWSDYKQNSWTIGFQPSYRTEAQIYAKYALAQKPDAKIGFLYQNDDFGKDYLAGVRDVLGDGWSKHVVQTASYELTDPTIDSQVVSLQGSGADVLISAAAPKAAAQIIRKVHDIGWKPLFFMSNVSISVGAVMRPAGPDKGIGVISTGFLKDPTDPGFANDPQMQDWRDFMARYLPGADLSDLNYVYGYTVCRALMHVLDKCAGDFSRQNVMRQTTDVHDLEIPTLLPGIRVNTAPDNYRPIQAMQLQRWNGTTWERFGEVIQGLPA